MKRITAFIVLVIFAFSIYSCTQQEKKITLKFKYKPGMKLEYHQDSKKQTEVFVADTLAKKGFDEFEAFVDQSIKEVIDDSTVIIHEKDTWRYTEPNKEDSTVLDTVEHSREMELKVLNNGKILDFEIVGGEKKRESYIKNYYEQGLPVFPSVEVSPGYSWTQTTAVVLPEETMNATTTYTIKSLVREMGYDCATIEYKGNLLIPIEPLATDSTQRSGIDRINSDGMIYFAYKEGIVIKQTEKWKTAGERTHLKDGDWQSYSFKADYDVVFVLTKAEGVKQ